MAFFHIDMATLYTLSLTSSLLPHWCPSSLLIHMAIIARQSQGSETFNDLDCDFDSEMTLVFDDANKVAIYHLHSSLPRDCEVDCTHIAHCARDWTTVNDFTSD